MEHAASGTYQTYLSETIHFQAPTNTLDPQEIASLYLDQRLSTVQIGQRLGCSTGYARLVLKRLGLLLRTKTEAQTDPKNYRNPVAPYGYRVVDGKLTPYPSELKVCRLIVDLIDRRGLNALKTAQYLTQKEMRNRRGTTAWHNYTVSRIYQRWKGKL